MNHPIPFVRRFVLLALLVALCVGCDQVTKETAQQQLARRAPISLWGDTVRLHYSHNPGGMLGLAGHLPAETRALICQVASAAVLGGMLLYALFKRHLPAVELVAVALIVGGGLGNIVDRIVLNGEVRDFLNLGIGPLRTGIFNVADVLIFGGIGLILVSRLFDRPATSSPASS
ncbi:MAG TPA: signal peptidase II [Ardenticatenaceae bacterium]|nr:signal peptidase II [Ardenticatenaceae bacterium]